MGSCLGGGVGSPFGGCWSVGFGVSVDAVGDGSDCVPVGSVPVLLGSDDALVALMNACTAFPGPPVRDNERRMAAAAAAVLNAASRHLGTNLARANFAVDASGLRPRQPPAPRRIKSITSLSSTSLFLNA